MSSDKDSSVVKRKHKLDKKYALPFSGALARLMIDATVEGVRFPGKGFYVRTELPYAETRARRGSGCYFTEGTPQLPVEHCHLHLQLS